MSAADPTAAGEWRVLHGWGRTAPSRARVVRPRTAAEVAQALSAAPSDRGAIARGAGRSYGDPAQNAGGTVIDTTSLRGVHELDARCGLVSVGAGTTLAELLRYLLPHDLTLSVLPGTRHVTVAGAIAADVHGKNHLRDGSFVRHVASLTLCTPTGEVLEVSHEHEPELLLATAGGMGLTGVITRVTLRTCALRTPWVAADIDRTADLEQALALMDGQRNHRYAIAWVDLCGRDGAWGRAVVTRCDDLPAEGSASSGPPPGTPRPRHTPHDPRSSQLAAKPLLSIPAGMPGWMLRPASVRAFNAWHWRSAPQRERGRLLDMRAHLFPLDAVGSWNRLYGAAGLMQYQFVVPHGQVRTLRTAAEHLRRQRLPVYLATIKRFGEASGGPLSFPLPGWTLAMDIPADAPGLHAALDELDELVAQAGGRVYLAKDVRLRPQTLAAMYPQLARFQELRARVDPRGAMRSDMARRLGLCAKDTVSAKGTP
ncbi:MAG TPA: FAD-binding oxidoreductase [Solirubrobacteraceae bacterium]|jgi:decaprenylphospho-beta-D-ribofuranose 2-oxidase|nr:FAD-binding oxidoreductase [Solirubrobacteraceae bacterium]